MILKNTNLIVKDFISLYNLRLITQASMIDKQKIEIIAPLLGAYLSKSIFTYLIVINRYNERNSETFNNVIDINRFISKIKNLTFIVNCFFNYRNKLFFVAYKK